MEVRKCEGMWIASVWKTGRCVRKSEAWKGESERGLNRDLKTYIQIAPTS